MRKLMFVLLLISSVSKPQWIQIPSSPSGFITNIININDTLYASHSGSGVYVSTDSMVSWQQINNGLNNSDSRQTREVIKYNGSLYVAAVDGIYKSTDNGNEWIKKSNGITIGPGALKEFCESIFEYNGVLHTGAWNGIYRSTDEAESWGITNAAGEGVKAKNFENHNGILFAARENINFPVGYYSSDSGVTWNQLTSLAFPTITFFSEPEKLWAGTIHGAWVSTDTGSTWESRSEGLNPDPYNTSFVRVNGALITSLHFGGSGIFISYNDGILWENFGQGLPFLNAIEKLILYSDKIIAATSQGLWQRDTSSVVTQFESKEMIVSEFALYQNYPNPFNPRTSIEYRIASSEYVRLRVYDLLGREVATLVDEYKPAGSDEVEFNAINLSGGMYFYTLQTGNYTETKKMILLR